MNNPFADLQTIEEVQRRFNEFEEAGEGRIYWHAANRRKIYLHYRECKYMYFHLFPIYSYIIW